MKTNIGSTDRSIRLLLALAIGGLGYYYGSVWGYLAAVPLLTAFVRFCPLYAVLGVSTCSVR